MAGRSSGQEQPAAVTVAADRCESDPLRDLDATLYAELRSISARALRGERAPGRPGTTSLVHEIWLRIARSATEVGSGRERILALASVVARRALVDAARRRKASKRGAGMPTSAAAAPSEAACLETPDEILAIDEVLNGLAIAHPRQAKALELRMFGGVPPHAIALALGISPTQAKRDVAFARAWLSVALRGDRPSEAQAQARSDPSAGGAPRASGT